MQQHKEVKKSLMFILGIFLIGIVSAANYCCEMTTNNAYCQNVPDSAQCAIGTNPLTGEEYKSLPALCESTSYCKIGTCINSVEGTCIQSPRMICEANGGTWNAETNVNSIPQCKPGCCLIGSNAAFVTKVTCNKFSEMYSVTTKFQESVADELTCLANANPGDEGACVYTREFSETCERTTREECTNRIKNSSVSNVTFYNGYLCTSEEIGSICSKPTQLSTVQTRCDDNGDVRFVDGCGNLANIYNSNRINDYAYWEKISYESGCSDPDGSKNSETCGDCDYLAGSICSDKEGKPVSGGDYICKNLDCTTYRGEYYGGGYSGTGVSYATADNYPRHGESWCASTSDNDTVGSTDFKLLCMFGEVTLDECDSGRDKLCFQSESEYIEDYSLANCRKNYWESCTLQNNSEDCIDIDIGGDCKWIAWRDYAFTEDGLLPNGDEDTDNDGDEDNDGVCVPLYPPAFARDQNQEVIGGEMCTGASTACLVMEKKTGLFGDWECDENCYCDPEDDDYDDFAKHMNEICTSIGDCGVKTNYFGKDGKYTLDDREIFKKERYEDGDPD